MGGDMAKIARVNVQIFDVPLAEVLTDAKHGDHTHFELVIATVTTCLLYTSPSPRDS